MATNQIAIGQTISDEDFESLFGGQGVPGVPQYGYDTTGIQPVSNEVYAQTVQPVRPQPQVGETISDADMMALEEPRRPEPIPARLPGELGLAQRAYEWFKPRPEEEGVSADIRRGVLATPEVAARLGIGAASFVASGIGGLIGGLSWDKPWSLEQANKMVEWIQSAPQEEIGKVFIGDPKTQAIAMQATEYAVKPFEWLHEGATFVGDKVTEATGNADLGASVATALEGAALIFGPKILKGVKAARKAPMPGEPGWTTQKGIAEATRKAELVERLQESQERPLAELAAFERRPMPYSPELATAMAEEPALLPPGQGFQLRPATRIRKGYQTPLPPREPEMFFKTPEGVFRYGEQEAIDRPKILYRRFGEEIPAEKIGQEIPSQEEILFRQFGQERPPGLSEREILSRQFGEQPIPKPPVEQAAAAPPGIEEGPRLAPRERRVVTQRPTPYRQRAPVGPEKATTLAGFVKEAGGIFDPSLPGELNEIARALPGLKRKETGLPFDEMARTATEYGWLPEGATSTDLIAALKEDLRAIKEKGTRVPKVTETKIYEPTPEEAAKESAFWEEEYNKYIDEHPETMQQGEFFTQEGKVVDPEIDIFEAAKRQPKKSSSGITLENLGFQTIYENAESWAKAVRRRSPEEIKTVIENAKKLSTEPTNNPVDRGASAFIRSGGNLDAYLNEIKGIGELTVKEVAKHAKGEFATIRTKAGKQKPAIRRSGLYATQEFYDALEGFEDIGKLEQMWTDPTRTAQKMDQGKFGGPVQQQIVWPARLNQIAKLAWTDGKMGKFVDIVEKFGLKNGSKAEAVADIGEFVNTERAKWKIKNVVDLPEVQNVIGKFSPKTQAALAKASQEIRLFYDELIGEQNKGRANRNQKAIGYVESYVPRVRDANLWSRAKGWLKGVDTKSVMESPEMPDFINPNQPFVRHALARTALMPEYPLERNIVRLMTDYIHSAAMDIFDTNIIHNNKIHSAVLKSRGLENGAAFIDRWTSEVFAGVKPRARKLVAETVPAPLRKAATTIRRNLTRAVFPLNFEWNAFVQTSSAGLTYARYGEKASAYGLKYLTDPAMREAIRQTAYSSILKRRWGGKAAYQDVQGSILKNKRLETRLIDRVEDAANFMTSAVEDALTGHAVAAAYYHGRTKLGLRGRALWEYASEGGAKTQSMYDFGNQPGLLREGLGTLFPFQTFAFEVFNTVREMQVPVLRRITGKTGAYETIAANTPEGSALLSKRIGMIMRWSAAIMVTNAVGQRLSGRKPWTVQSFLPFFGYMFGGYAGKGPVAREYVDDALSGIKQALVDGNFKKLRKWAIRYNLVAGTQVNRMLDGIEAVAKGQVEDVRGRKMFPIEGEAEEIMAILRGPHKTRAGRKYWKEKEKKKGLKGLVGKMFEEKEEVPPWMKPPKQGAVQPWQEKPPWQQ